MRISELLYIQDGRELARHRLGPTREFQIRLDGSTSMAVAGTEATLGDAQAS